MSTQGMVSVVWCGRVVAKVVSGSDGWHAKEVAKEIVEGVADGIPETGALDVIADAHGFGRKGLNRITVARRTNVPTDEELVGLEDLVEAGEDVLVARVRKTFRLRRFNPRWDKGSADHVWVANMDSRRAYRTRPGMPIR